MMQGTPFECIRWLSEQPQDERYEVKQVRKRRSLTANAYYWVMLNKLARKLQLPDSEVHMNMLREYGTCEVFSLSMAVNPDEWFRYWDALMTDWDGSEERQVIKVYKGSSSMDSAEFAHLVNGMRDECEAQGLDVMTPSELASLRFIEGKEG